MQNQINQIITRNKDFYNQQIISRRDLFIQGLITLARDKANPQSQSAFAPVPKELILYMISLMDFESEDSNIDKTPMAIKKCAQFIFDHTKELQSTLQEASKRNKVLK